MVENATDTGASYDVRWNSRASQYSSFLHYQIINRARSLEISISGGTVDQGQDVNDIMIKKSSLELAWYKANNDKKRAPFAPYIQYDFIGNKNKLICFIWTK